MLRLRRPESSPEQRTSSPWPRCLRPFCPGSHTGPRSPQRATGCEPRLTTSAPLFSDCVCVKRIFTCICFSVSPQSGTTAIAICSGWRTMKNLWQTATFYFPCTESPLITLCSHHNNPYRGFTLLNMQEPLNGSFLPRLSCSTFCSVHLPALN